MTPLPAIRHADHQQVIWPWVGNKPIKNSSQLRNVIGDFFEAASAKLTGAKRLRTDGRSEICPDLAHDDTTFLEVKACRNGLVLYDDRLAKDLKLIDERWASLTYLVWLHHGNTAVCKTTHDVHTVLADNIEALLVIPFDRVYKAAMRKKPNMIKYRQDSTERKAARRLTKRELLGLADGPVAFERPIGRVYQQVMGYVQLRGTDLGLAFPPITEKEKRAAGEMLAGLSTTMHHISLAPAPDPRHPTHQVRVVESRNPDWYRYLCREYLKKRAKSRQQWGDPLADTDIRRPFVLRALDRLSHGVCRWRYDWRVRPYVFAAANHNPLLEDMQ